jgi:hypothetical protein
MGQVSLLDMNVNVPGYENFCILFLFFLGIKAARVAISLYAEYFLLKRFYVKNKPFFLLDGEKDSFQQIKGNNSEKEKASFLKKILLKKERDSYSFFEKEFAKLILLIDSKRDKHETQILQSCFYSMIKDSIFKRNTTIISTIYISFLTVFFVIAMMGITITDATQQAYVTIGSLVAGIYGSMYTPCFDLLIILLLCLFMYRSLKKKYYLIFDETNKLIDQIDLGKT